MARKKYIKDYRLLETLDEKGRIKTDYEYIGEHYRFSEPVAAKKALRLILAAMGAGWALFIGALIPLSAAATTFYVILPFIFTAIPLWLMTELAIRGLRLPETFERRLADRMDRRPAPAAGFIIGLPAAALLGELVSFLIDGSRFSLGDVFFSLFAALVCGAGAFALSMRGRLKTEKAQ